MLSKAKQPDIGKEIDNAMETIEKDNPLLKDVLPKVYARGNLDPTNLGSLLDLIGNIALGDAKAILPMFSAMCLNIFWAKIVKEDAYLINLSIKIDFDNSKVDNQFFYYLYLHASLRYLDSGSAQSQITINDLEKVIILLSPIFEQRAIASVLSSLDDKIGLLHRQNKTLEAMAETLFRQWFVEEAEEGWRKKKFLMSLTL